jgi:hypothetical protein
MGKCRRVAPFNEREETMTTARPLGDIIADLSKPIAPEDLESRKQGGTTLFYISWHRALKYLDRYAPGWSYEVKDIYHLAGRVALVVRISIPCAEGIVYREATGQEDEEKAGYGDPTSNAESMALRRAAAKFGLGLYLYDKEKKPAPPPVRNVKLEGAQPQPTKPADVLLDLNRKLGYTESGLLRWLTVKYAGVVGAQTLNLALAALRADEMSQAIDIFSEKVKNGGK